MCVWCLNLILLHTLSSHHLEHMLCWFAGNLSLCHLAVTLPPTQGVKIVKFMWFHISLQDFLFGLTIADLQSAWNQWLSRNVTCDLLPCGYMYLHFYYFMTLDCIDSWNALSWKTMACIYYQVNAVAADCLATQDTISSRPWHWPDPPGCNTGLAKLR